MPDVRIDNPILNSPYEEPQRHFRFSEDGITDEIVEGRRKSTYIVPIPQPRGRGKQLALPTFQEMPQENQFVDHLRERVKTWRMGGYAGTTAVTKKLLYHWRGCEPDRKRADRWCDSEREHKLFFCQTEAVETAIYIAEAARHYNDDVEKQLRAENAKFNGELFRLAFKMATGSGKTLVMAMLIAWQVLNKRDYPRDPRFTDRFLLVTPGITIKDRLRVLQPNDADNYYSQRDLVPPGMMEHMHRARIVITNFHQFKLRDKVEANKTTKQILLQGRDENPFIETPDQMVVRVCGSLGSKGEIIVINDEAHHCYQVRPAEKGEKIDRDEKDEAKQRQEDARLWFEGLKAVQNRLGIKTVYDLSATPFFLRGSGYGENVIFPWVVSDFSLVDAIESGIVKIPRVPVTDNAQDVDGPINRMVWANIRDELRDRTKADSTTGEPSLPAELEAALRSLYADYEKRYEAWAVHKTTMPPVMIVVCNNTTVSNLVYRFIAGWEEKIDEQTVRHEGNLALFNNVDGDDWLPRPNTILVDSRQLESGEGLSSEFKKVAARELDVFTEEYRRRFPERSADSISEADLLREVMNTVGKRGKLGENVRCVVSVSMLTEGWDVNSVTHVLGVRAFSTQLICEQVVGRGLRRMSYELNDDGRFSPEYAEIYGVPFAFIPTSGKKAVDAPVRPTYHVQTDDSRPDAQITFPRLIGYRFESPDGELVPHFNESSRVVLSPEEFPTRTIVAGLTGEESEHTLKLDALRMQQIQFDLARRVLENLFYDHDKDDDSIHVHVWRFPDVLAVVRQWFDGGYLILKDGTSAEMLQIAEKRDQAVHVIIEAIRRGETRERQNSIIAVLATDTPVGSTRGVSFDTIRPVYETGDKCPINFAVLDTDKWEQTVVQALEAMPEVARYVKNYRIGFTIPYSLRGVPRSYTPDFIAVLENGTNLIIEVTGEREREDKVAKVSAAQELWVPAVNRLGEFGRWDAVEITDPYMTETIIRAYLNGKPIPTLL